MLVMAVALVAITPLVLGWLIIRKVWRLLLVWEGSVMACEKHKTEIAVASVTLIADIEEYLKEVAER